MGYEGGSGQDSNSISRTTLPNSLATRASLGYRPEKQPRCYTLGSVVASQGVLVAGTLRETASRSIAGMPTGTIKTFGRARSYAGQPRFIPDPRLLKDITVGRAHGEVGASPKETDPVLGRRDRFCLQGYFLTNGRICPLRVRATSGYRRDSTLPRALDGGLGRMPLPDHRPGMMSPLASPSRRNEH